MSDGSGTATVSAAAQIVYQPSAGYFGATTFTYTVRGRPPDPGRPGASGPVAVTVIGRPGAPSTPQATADNATATVTWGLPPANGAPHHRPWNCSPRASPRSRSASPAATRSPASSTGAPYRFQVRAQNEAGWSEWSGWSAPVTPDTIPGRVPTPSVAFGDGQLTVTWQAPPNEGSALTGYEIEIGGGLNSVIARGTATTYMWDGLANGTNYQFRIVAMNAAGRSDPSPWSDPEHPLRQPDAPGTPNVQRGNRYLDLSWSPSVNNGDPVIEYQVRMQSNPNTWVPVGSATTYRWSDLPNGVAQQFQVRSRNRDVDWSAPSGVVGGREAVRRTRPTRSTERGARRRPARVTYTSPGDQGCAITQTQIEASGGATQTAAGSPHTFTGLANGTSYTFRVRSLNEEGWGAVERRLQRRHAGRQPAGPELDQLGELGRRRGHGSRGPPPRPTAPHSPLRHLDQQRCGAQASGSPPRYTRGALSNGTAYTFKVRACNDVGCGAWSPNTSITTWGEPEPAGSAERIGRRRHDLGLVDGTGGQRPTDRPLQRRTQPRRQQGRRRHLDVVIATMTGFSHSMTALKLSRTSLLCRG